jgi:hypothetical protein
MSPLDGYYRHRADQYRSEQLADAVNAKCRELPGRIEVVRCDLGWYWHAYVGDKRVNGGLCEVSSQQASYDARWAITCYRSSEYMNVRQEFMRSHYWDDETEQWIKHGELPPL